MHLLTELCTIFFFWFVFHTQADTGYAFFSRPPLLKQSQEVGYQVAVFVVKSFLVQILFRLEPFQVFSHEHVCVYNTVVYSLQTEGFS